MSIYKASQSINLPQLQNLIKRDPESYRDEVCFFWMFHVCFWSIRFAHVVDRAEYMRMTGGEILLADGLLVPIVSLWSAARYHMPSMFSEPFSPRICRVSNECQDQSLDKHVTVVAAGLSKIRRDTRTEAGSSEA